MLFLQHGIHAINLAMNLTHAINLTMNLTTTTVPSMVELPPLRSVRKKHADKHDDKHADNTPAEHDHQLGSGQLPTAPGHVPEPPKAERRVVTDKFWGMNAATYALVFATFSGISLPIGAGLGILLSPVSDKITSMMMAFGAGALLFAVTVELYGHALAEVAAGNSGITEMLCTGFGALAGCWFYLFVNEKLQHWLNPSDDLVVEHLAVQKEAPENDPDSLARKVLTKMKLRAREKVIMKMHSEEDEEVQHAKSVALALFLGLLIDGVPEGILMGFLAAEHHLTPVLIISLLIANFPEAFSSASLLIQAEMPIPKIIGMWAGLCVLVGCLAGTSCYLLNMSFPEFGQPGAHHSLPEPVLVGIALTEGITGGAMLACIAGVALPEAFERGGKSGPVVSQSGFLCVCGFILSVFLKTFFG